MDSGSSKKLWTLLHYHYIVVVVAKTPRLVISWLVVQILPYHMNPNACTLMRIKICKFMWPFSSRQTRLYRSFTERQVILNWRIFWFVTSTNDLPSVPVDLVDFVPMPFQALFPFYTSLSTICTMSNRKHISYEPVGAEEELDSYDNQKPSPSCYPPRIWTVITHLLTACSFLACGYLISREYTSLKYQHLRQDIVQPSNLDGHLGLDLCKLQQQTIDVLKCFFWRLSR